VAGAHLFTDGAARTTQSDEGWITSACYSPHVGRAIGLGFLVNGDQRLDEVIVAANPLEGGSARLRVVPAHFVDPEGGCLRD
jgi:sarcosine oxidase subunit alpha